MPIRLTHLLFLWICIFPLKSYASVKPVSPNCDTIITTTGQVLLVQLADGSNDSIVRFTYCGETGQKITDLQRTNIREIRKAHTRHQQLPEGSAPVVVQNGLPEGSEPVVVPDGLPEGSERILPEIQKNTTVDKILLEKWAKIAAIGGFGSIFMFLFSFAFSPILLLLVLPLSIMGFVFALKVLKRSKRIPEFKKYRRLSAWSMAMSLAWLGLILLYIIGVFFIIILLFI